MKFTTILLAITFPYFSYTQVDNKTNLEDLEIELQGLINSVITSKDSLERVTASQKVEHKLELFFETENSYEYDFKNLKGISFLRSSDNKFRIITWQLYENLNKYTYLGYIQKSDNSFIKLFDKSSDMGTVEFSSHKPRYWYGALYYNMKSFKYQGKDCYMLFGFDAFEFYNKRKVLDVLHFDEKGNAKFGLSVIEIQDAYKRFHTVKRFLLEYSASVNVSLNFSEELNMIVYDHLIYGTPVKGGGPSNVPDGSYCGLKLEKDGLWKYVDKVHKDDPNNVLIDATTYDKMLNTEKKKNYKRDIFGRSKSKG